MTGKQYVAATPSLTSWPTLRDIEKAFDAGRKDAISQVGTTLQRYDSKSYDVGIATYSGGPYIKLSDVLALDGK